jgi:hypothetical protein
MYKLRMTSTFGRTQGLISVIPSSWRTQPAISRLAFAAALALFCNNNIVAEELLYGPTLSSAQSAQGGENSFSTALSALVSIRPSPYYGTDFQLGAFGQSGPFDYSLWLDGAAVAYLPLGRSGINLYAKAGLANIYSFTSNGSASTLAPTYGTGIEFKGTNNAVRLSFQHYNVGNTSLSPALSSNLVGISYLGIVK